MKKDVMESAAEESIDIVLALGLLHLQTVKGGAHTLIIHIKAMSSVALEELWQV